MGERGIPTISVDELDWVLRRAKNERWESLTLAGPNVGDWIEREPGFDPDRAFRLREKLTTVPPALLESTHLRSLLLPGQSLGEAGARAIAERLTSLTTLDLGDNNIGEAGARTIAERLTGRTTLNLRYNNIGEAGARAIAERLTGLTTLNLRYNNIGEAGARAIAERLTGLTTLNLWYNNIGEAGARAIAERLTGLTTLNLKNNAIGLPGIRAIAGKLELLVDLDVESPTSGQGFGVAGAEAIAAGLKKLQRLNVAFNNIGDAGARAIALSLRQLKTLDLRENAITIVPRYVLGDLDAPTILAAIRASESNVTDSAPDGGPRKKRTRRPATEKREDSSSPPIEHPTEIASLTAPNPDQATSPETPPSSGGHATPIAQTPTTTHSSTTTTPVATATSKPPTRFIYGGREHFQRDADESEIALNADKYADAIAHLFRRGGEDFCFGLFGHWGRGKTFLMKLVSKRLEQPTTDESRAAAPEYAVVNFSAWAYPQTPTLWAHLYETIAERATRDGWWRCLPIVVRAGIARHGIWSLIGALLLFAVSVIPLVQWVQWLQPFAGALGLSGLFYLVRVGRAGRSLARTPLSHLWSLARHEQPLGLQAVIGRDLEALLLGWRPPTTKDAESRSGGAERNLRSAFGVWSTLGYFGASLVGTWALSPLASGALKEGGWPLALSLATSLVWLVATASFWLLARGTMPSDGGSRSWVRRWLPPVKFLSLAPLSAWLTRFFPPPPKQVLLVVDDLDRCKTDAMLEVMEGLKQFLESSAVRARLQVAMLVDEAALASAILEKYGNLAHESIALRPTPRQLVIENVEKLFVSYLRLPELGDGEVRDLTERIFANLRKDKAAQQRPAAPERDNQPDELRPTADASPKGSRAPGASVTSTPGTSAESPQKPAGVAELPREQVAAKARELEAELDLEIAFSDAEERQIAEELIGVVSGGGDGSRIGEAARIGPRTVRSFLFRYQLARLMLNRTGAHRGVQELARTLALADAGESAGDQRLATMTDQVSLGRVVRQLFAPPKTLPSEAIAAPPATTPEAPTARSS